MRSYLNDDYFILVDRTFTNRSLFSMASEQHEWTKGQFALCRMLQYVSIKRREDLGYCQGMNFVAATLLQIFDGDEIIAAGCFTALLFRSEIGRMFEPTLATAQLACLDLDSLIRHFLPKLHRHFRQLGESSIQTFEGVRLYFYNIYWRLTLLVTGSHSQRVCDHRLDECPISMCLFPMMYSVASS